MASGRSSLNSVLNSTVYDTHKGKCLGPDCADLIGCLSFDLTILQFKFVLLLCNSIHLLRSRVVQIKNLCIREIALISPAVSEDFFTNLGHARLKSLSYLYCQRFSCTDCHPRCV